MRTVSILTLFIIVISAVVTLFGILSDGGAGSFDYESIRGVVVDIYGRGIYGHMSSEVAIQGIAQDYVTLFIGIPILIISLLGYRRGSTRCSLLLAGTLMYFFVKYLFYTAMAMYNVMFLGYVSLMGLSFFAFMSILLKLDVDGITSTFGDNTPTKFAGGFLIFNSVSIALLWLGVVVPPLLDGTIYPTTLQHYTTLIVQGFDLGLLLPLSFVFGLRLIRREPLGYIGGTIYVVFLSILMTALTAKVIAMAVNGVNVIPVIFIIPTFNVIAVYFLFIMVRSVRKIA